MGDLGLLQQRPDVSNLLPERGDDREQTAAADGPLGGLDAMADLAVDHRLPQRSYSCGEGRLPQVLTVLAQGVVSPRLERKSTTRCNVCSNANRIDWQQRQDQRSVDGWGRLSVRF